MTQSSTITRRKLLQTGLAAGAVSAVGLPALSGCSNEGRGGTGSQAADDAALLPDYIPYDGVQPDLVGENGVDSATMALTADPQPVTDGPRGDGAAVSALALIITPNPPGLENNSYWQQLNRRLGFELDMSLVPSADFEQRFQTAVAGDQLPDLFTMYTGRVPSPPGVLAEKAADLTPYLAGDAVQRYPFLANVPTPSWQSAVYGGKIYGIPIPRGAQSSQTLYALRDLLEADGIDEAPDSLESFLAAPLGTAEHLFKTYGTEGEHHELEATDPVLTDTGRSETQLGLKYLSEGPWVNYQAGRPEVTRAQFDAQDVVVPEALPNPVLGLCSETQSRRGGQIGQALATLKGDIMQGREPVSAWSDAVATWESSGGDTIRDESQQALEQRNGG